MSSPIDFDRARAQQISAEGRKALGRAAALDGVAAAETLEWIFGLGTAELGDPAVLREGASLCLAISHAGPARSRICERDIHSWTCSAMSEVASARRPFHRGPLNRSGGDRWQQIAAGLGGLEQAARLQGRLLLEACSVADPAAGAADLWPAARDVTLEQMREIAAEGLARGLEAERPRRSAYGEEEVVEDVLERALVAAAMLSPGHPEPAFAALGALAELDEQMFGAEGELPGAIERAALLADGGGFAGGARVDFGLLREALIGELISFAPSVTRAVRAELGGELRSDNGSHYLKAAMEVSLVWLWSARHARAVR